MNQSVAPWERTPAFAFDAVRGRLSVLDQTRLPFEERWLHPASVADCVQVIRAMNVRGAPLIGLVAAAGIAFATREDSSDAGLARAAGALLASRPTAVNLGWALARMQARLAPEPPTVRAAIAAEEVLELQRSEYACCERIGAHGAERSEERV